MRAAADPTSTLRDRELSGFVGMVVALGAFAMWFAALFFAYAALRARAPMWPPDGDPRLPVGLPGLNTLVLAASSGALGLATRALDGGAIGKFRRLAAMAMALGALFLALQLRVWIDVWRGGLMPSSSAYGSVFYALTAVHAAHVLGGLLAVGITAVGARGPSVQRAAMFWHFVGAVWIPMYLFVYVM